MNPGYVATDLSAVYTTPPAQAAILARSANPRLIRDALIATRRRTLGLLNDYAQALGPQMQIPYGEDLNPPLWEAGHIAWFCEWWVSRNRQDHLQAACDPYHERLPSRFPSADALYDSSRVAHPDRWDLPLPALESTLAYLQDSLADTLSQLDHLRVHDHLYFFQLVLFHEQMHNEAAVYMAQALDIPLRHEWAFVSEGTAPLTGASLSLPAGSMGLGASEGGFCFDNELGPHTVAIDAFEMDAGPVSWQQYLAFTHATGYPLPAAVSAVGAHWRIKQFGTWVPLNVQSPVVHVNWDDANAWCQWAGRQLPTEAQWQYAASIHPEFAWGHVWEWTGSTFNAFPGFEPHPYRDYSEPWFGSRPVLKGGCLATDWQMKHPRYRNYFMPQRQDIFAGFRSCRPL